MSRRCGVFLACADMMSSLACGARPDGGLDAEAKATGNERMRNRAHQGGPALAGSRGLALEAAAPRRIFGILKRPAGGAHAREQRLRQNKARARAICCVTLSKSGGARCGCRSSQ